VKQYYDTFGTARRLHTSRQTLANWRLAGFGPSFIRCGRKILYEESELIRWLTERTGSSTSEFSESNSQRSHHNTPLETKVFKSNEDEGAQPWRGRGRNRQDTPGQAAEEDEGGEEGVE
jgi:hypothetical protein